MQFLPRSEDVEGWTLQEDPEVYPAARLHEWIAGEADEFREYRIVDATIGRYEGTGGTPAIVELLRFPDFVQAFGAWSSRSFPRAEPLEVTNRGVATRFGLHAWRGPFYIRITAGGKSDEASPSEEPATREGETEDSSGEEEDVAGDESAESGQNENAQPSADLQTLLRTTIEEMPEAPGLPAVMRFLPPRDRIAGTERYIARAGFGHPFLANSFLVDYSKQSIPNEEGEPTEAQDVTGLILPSPSREVAGRIFGALRSFYERNGRVLDPVPNLGEQNFTGEDEYTGRMVAFRIDRFVVAFKGFADREVLREMAVESDSRIISAIRQALEQAEMAERERTRREQ